MFDLVETALLNLAAQTLGGTISKPLAIGGNWTTEELQRTLNLAPTVRIAYAGGPVDPESSLVQHEAGWVCYVVTRGVTEESRRLGGPQTIGAFEMLRRLLPALHGHTIAGIGTCQATRVDNLFAESGMDAGGAVYAIRFKLNMAFGGADDRSAAADIAGLADFRQFHADYDLEPFSPERHEEWLGEDHTGLAPDAQDDISAE